MTCRHFTAFLCPLRACKYRPLPMSRTFTIPSSDPVTAIVQFIISAVARDVTALVWAWKWWIHSNAGDRIETQTSPSWEPETKYCSSAVKQSSLTAALWTLQGGVLLPEVLLQRIILPLSVAAMTLHASLEMRSAVTFSVIWCDWRTSPVLMLQTFMTQSQLPAARPCESASCGTPLPIIFIVWRFWTQSREVRSQTLKMDDSCSLEADTANLCEVEIPRCCINWEWPERVVFKGPPGLMRQLYFGDIWQLSDARHQVLAASRSRLRYFEVFVSFTCDSLPSNWPASEVGSACKLLAARERVSLRVAIISSEKSVNAKVKSCFKLVYEVAKSLLSCQSKLQRTCCFNFSTWLLSERW